MTKTGLMLFLAILVALIYSLYSTINTTVDHKAAGSAAVIVDNSTSQTVNCSAFPALVASSFEGMKLRPKSKISVYTLGSEHSSWEPVLQLSPTLIPHKSGNFGGSMQKLTPQLAAICASFGSSPGSSIHRALQVVLQQMAIQQGCGKPGTDPCRLIAQTDLEESVARRLFRDVPVSDPPLLNNQGVEVVLCGFSSIKGSGPRGQRTEMLITRWRSQFTVPASVTFMPLCPGQQPRS